MYVKYLKNNILFLILKINKKILNLIKKLLKDIAKSHLR